MVRTIVLFISIVLCSTSEVNSQTIINAVQGFNFGTFYQGNSGGTVTISSSGSRSATGDIVLMNTGSSALQAIFEIEAPSGTVISILEEQDAMLTGSNGGSLTLQLQALDLGNPFTTTVAPPNHTRINIGGMLTIGNTGASPAGSYTGTFNITINQE